MQADRRYGKRARAADAAEQPDLNQRRQDAEQVAGPDADLVLEVRSSVPALLEPSLHA